MTWKPLSCHFLCTHILAQHINWDESEQTLHLYENKNYKGMVHSILYHMFRNSATLRQSGASCTAGEAWYCKSSLVPRPLPYFISQPWRKTQDKIWSGLGTRETVYVITKNVQFPQTECLLRRQCSDLSLATIMFPMCTSRGSKSCH